LRFIVGWRRIEGRDGCMRRGFLITKRRNGFDITRDILQVCMKGANKTHIVYAANLNSKRVNTYLEFCAQMKLLTKKSNGGNFIYLTTSDGLLFMRNYSGGHSDITGKNNVISQLGIFYKF
jgi:predicted transcriptional regulator